MLKYNAKSQVVQGIGGGGLIVLLSIILSDVIPMRERGIWQGWLNVLSMVGMSIGAPLGKQARFILSLLRLLQPTILKLQSCTFAETRIFDF